MTRAVLVFETAAFDRSATPPERIQSRWVGLAWWWVVSCRWVWCGSIARAIAHRGGWFLEAVIRAGKCPTGWLAGGPWRSRDINNTGVRQSESSRSPMTFAMKIRLTGGRVFA
jgi:hypothetical protein